VMSPLYWCSNCVATQSEFCSCNDSMRASRNVLKWTAHDLTRTER
jgi:hypothetical protein